MEQSDKQLRCGLLGQGLGHSFSPQLHALLGDYRYDCFECPPQELESFLREGAWDAVNVTMPYKKAVLPYCAEVSETVKRLGCVNVLLRRADGSLYGDNTDYDGFRYMVERSGFAVAGETVLVLGSGGASATACAVLRELGAEVQVLSRNGGQCYGDLTPYRHARYIVNTTPLGMYPNNGTAAVDLRSFPRCRGVLDVIYNPAKTAIMLQAEELGIPAQGGLAMLTAQAVQASARFTGRTLPESLAEELCQTFEKRQQNIILIGMPGCGKSTLSAELGRRMGRTVEEADAAVEERLGCSAAQWLTERGEDSFRTAETQVLRELGKRTGRILATGGGCVVRAENYPLLHQNGVIFWVRRELDKLETCNRPLSQGNLRELYERREPLYARFADFTVDNNGTVGEAVEELRRLYFLGASPEETF